MWESMGIRTTGWDAGTRIADDFVMRVKKGFLAMKKLIIFGMILACMGCASSQPIPVPPTPVTLEDPLVPLTAELVDLLQANGYGLTQLQFFISGPFILEKNAFASQTVKVTGDKIILNGGESSRRVILNDRTAGTGSLYTSIDGRVAVKISIENNPAQTLYFAKEGDAPDALLYLCRSPELFVDFGGEIYTAKFSGGAAPFLLVKLDNKYTSPSTQYYPRGDLLAHLMVGTYETRTAEGKTFFMELKPGGTDSNKARLFPGDWGNAVVYNEKGKKLAEGRFSIARNDTGQPVNAEETCNIIINFPKDMTNIVAKRVFLGKTEYLFTSGSSNNFVFRKGASRSFSGAGYDWILKP
jgi:hypothetical protein